MAEKTRIVVARLVRFEFLSKGGEALSSSSRHVLVSEVHWPRYTYQLRSSARTLEIKGAVREYGENDWIDAVLFKESVQLPSAVSFTLSVPAAPDVVSRVVAAIVKAGLGVVGDVAQEAAPTAGLGKMATAPFDALATLAGSATDPAPLGKASLIFDEALLSRGGERTLEFTAVRDISVQTSAASPNKGPSVRRRKIAVRKGDTVARAVVAFDAIG
ncbi:MAG: hypothetical protein IJS46_01720 [Kiritimatiellae bacterium]|nr:hypothetical protein [Kiritimatiellia bacterium]